MKLKEFSFSGLDYFSSFLDDMESNPALDIPMILLTDENLSKVLDENVDVDIKQFQTRWEIAKYLYSLFSQSSIKDVDRRKEMWAWLSAYFFDIICPKNDDGIRKIKERAAYIPEPENFRRYYRHLLLGPYLIYKAHSDNPQRAMAFLCKPPHILSDIDGQIAASKEYITNDAIVELTTKLYYDPMKKNIKSGAGGKGPGSPRRLVAVLNQLDLTWDLYASSCEELEKMLPKEFNGYRQ